MSIEEARQNTRRHTHSQAIPVHRRELGRKARVVGLKLEDYRLNRRWLNLEASNHWLEPREGSFPEIESDKQKWRHRSSEACLILGEMADIPLSVDILAELGR